MTDDQKTHKNPALRAGSKVEAKEKKPTSAPKAAAVTTVKKAPVCELQGKKWIVVCCVFYHCIAAITVLCVVGISCG